MKKILVIFLTVAIFLSLIACADSSFEQTMTIEDRIREHVEFQAKGWSSLHTIGDHELKRSSAHVSNIKEVTPKDASQKEYVVSGTFSAVDIYGTNYSNRFDAKVTYDEVSDKISFNMLGFDFVDKNWEKD